MVKIWFPANILQCCRITYYYCKNYKSYISEFKFEVFCCSTTGALAWLFVLVIVVGVSSLGLTAELAFSSSYPNTTLVCTYNLIESTILNP